jgi:hypothetical protein
MSKKLNRVRLERWAAGIHPDLRWAVIAAYRQETTLDFIYDSQGPGISVGGEKRNIHYSDLKLLECRLRNYGYVEKPSRIFFEYGEIFFYSLTERGKQFAKFLEMRAEKPYYRVSK